MPQKTQTKSFDEFINSSEVPVLVDFWAEWCGPCHALNPIMKEVAKELKGQLKVIKVNVDQKPQIAARYQIQGIPTMILFKNGEPVWRTSGVQQKQAIISQVKPHMG